jgi:hypothetical protein
MNNPETVFRDGSLKAVSARSSDPKEVSLGKCDILVLSSSQQERCRKIVESDSRASMSTIVLRADGVSEATASSSVGELDTFHLISQHFAATSRLEVITSRVRGEAQDLDRVIKIIAHAFNKNRGPLEIGIDLTCCPLFVCLGLIAFLLESGVVRRVRVFYAEGAYAVDPANEDPHELFTAGEWSAIAIPGLQYPWSPRRSRTYVIAVGFEGYKTLRLCDRREPDRVVGLFPDPGVYPDYVDRTLRANALLFDRYAVDTTAGSESLIRANAADAVAAWKELTLRNPERFDDYSVEYLCCGTKPHSLAIALRALCTKQGVVSDILADQYLKPSVAASGIFWRYDISDLSAI